MTRLLPCPLCGSESKINQSYKGKLYGAEHIYCSSNCGMNCYSSAAWNEHATHAESLREEIKKLRGELENMKYKTGDVLKSKTASTLYTLGGNLDKTWLVKREDGQILTYTEWELNTYLEPLEIKDHDEDDSNLRYCNVNVNGRHYRLPEDLTTYEQIVKLAFGGDADTSILYTVTVSYRALGKTVKPEETLHLMDGMSINVMDTGSA